MTEDFGFHLAGPEILLFSTVSTQALRPSQFPAQWVPGAIATGLKQPGHDGDPMPFKGVACFI
jgi:hypothetical protein